MRRSVSDHTVRDATPRVNIPNLSPEFVVSLADARYFNLVTFRRDGREVATPVWFASADGAYYVFSAGDAGKVKRIRAGSRARVAACDVRGKLLGDWHAASARLVGDPHEVQRAYRALRGKYGLSMALLDFFARLTGRYQKRQLIAVML
jgi:uncharacterized protein